MRLIALFLIACFTLCADSVALLKQRVAQEVPNLYGWCSPEKAQHLVDLVLETKPQVCVDIGTFGGRSLFPVASALKFLQQAEKKRSATSTRCAIKRT